MIGLSRSTKDESWGRASANGSETEDDSEVEKDDSEGETVRSVEETRPERRPGKDMGMAG